MSTGRLFQRHGAGDLRESPVSIVNYLKRQLYVVKGIKIEITAKFRASRCPRFEDAKRIMSPKCARKVSGLFEKRTSAPK